MLKNLVVLLIGALLGANVVYFVMTRESRSVVAVDNASPAVTPAAPVVPDAPNSDGERRAPTQATPPAVSPATSPSAVAPPAIASVQVSAPSGLIVPVSGITRAQLSDTFGDARGGERQHEALDIMAPAGTPVLAAADGSVEKLFDSKQGGLTIYQFEPSGRYAYYYAHLQSYAPGLVEKKTVKRGELIGYVGSTGNASAEAPHLHFAIFVLGPERQWWKGTPINPYPLLGGR